MKFLDTSRNMKPSIFTENRFFSTQKSSLDKNYPFEGFVVQQLFNVYTNAHLAPLSANQNIISHKYTLCWLCLIRMSRTWLRIFYFVYLPFNPEVTFTGVTPVCLQMAAKMPNFKPAQIFASINADPQVKKVEKPKVIHAPPTKDNEIQVSAIAEIEIVPDKCKLSLLISSKKEQVEDSKNSVQRRLDYILQTLTNHQVKVDTS